MTKQQKLHLLEDFENAWIELKDWSNLSADILDYRPAPERWTIREHIVHVLDADLNGISRARKAIAEPGAPIIPYEEEEWTARLHYDAIPLALVVDLVKGLRAFLSHTLRAMIDEDWTQYSYRHPINGPVTIEQYLRVYIDHIGFHREYIQRLKNRQ